MAAASRRLAALLLILSLGACAGQARELGMGASFTDGRFQVEWQRAQTTKGAPLIAGYGYHKGSWKGREGKKFSRIFEQAAVGAGR